MNKLGLICAGAAMLTSGFVSAEEQKPNFVFFLLDDWGWKDWGGNDTDFYETPSIDAIGREGLVFSQGYANAANCAPSRACLISGQYSPRHHMYNVYTIHRGVKGVDRFSLKDVPDGKYLDTRHVTFAEALKKGGYKSAMYGKWHVEKGQDAACTPEGQGFDESHWHHAPKLKKAFQENKDPKQMKTYTDKAMDFAQRCVDEKKPFCVYMSHHAVHAPDRYLPETYKHFSAKKPGQLHTHVKYASMLKDVDTQIGRFMKKLKSMGVDDNTVVIVMSDNGGTPPSPQKPLRAFKGSYYEGGLRVPYMVRWPGKIKPGVNNEVPVMGIDIYPTMLELAEIKAPENYDLDGTSLATVLLKGEDPVLKQRSLYWHYPAYLSGNKSYTGGRDAKYRQQPVSVIRKGDYKLIVYLEEWQLDGGRDQIGSNKAVEMYNLKNDISETDNLALKEPERSAQMLDLLTAWQQKVKAPLPKEKATHSPGSPKKSRRKKNKKK